MTDAAHGQQVELPPARRVHSVPELLEAILVLVNDPANCNLATKNMHLALAAPSLRAKWLVHRTPKGKHPFLAAANTKRRPCEVLLNEEVAKTLLYGSLSKYPLKRYEIQNLAAQLHVDSRIQLYLVLGQYGIQQYGAKSLLVGKRDRDILKECVRQGDLQGAKALVETYLFDDVDSAASNAQELLPFDGRQYPVVKYLGRVFGSRFVNPVLSWAFCGAFHTFLCDSWLPQADEFKPKLTDGFGQSLINNLVYEAVVYGNVDIVSKLIEMAKAETNGIHSYSGLVAAANYVISAVDDDFVYNVHLLLNNVTFLEPTANRMLRRLLEVPWLREHIAITTDLVAESLRRGNSWALELLLDAGATVDESPASSGHLLSIAIEQLDPVVILILLQKNAAVNAKAWDSFWNRERMPFLSVPGAEMDTQLLIFSEMWERQTAEADYASDGPRLPKESTANLTIAALEPPPSIPIRSIVPVDLILGRRLPWYRSTKPFSDEEQPYPQSRDLLQPRIACLNNDKLERATMHAVGKRVLAELCGSSTLAQFGAQAAWVFAARVSMDPGALCVLMEAGVPVRATTVMRCALEVIGRNQVFADKDGETLMVDHVIQDMTRGIGVTELGGAALSLARNMLEHYNYDVWRTCNPVAWSFSEFTSSTSPGSDRLEKVCFYLLLASYEKYLGSLAACGRQKDAGQDLESLAVALGSLQPTGAPGRFLWIEAILTAFLKHMCLKLVDQHYAKFCPTFLRASGAAVPAWLWR